MRMNLFRTKHIDAFKASNTGLKKCLTAFDLTLLGIGAIIGAGIFILTGIAAATKAGPAIVLSYVLAGLACSFTALAYAELSSTIGGSGSAYGYAYASMGEFIAWFIGWTLILEYGVAVAAVAIGWSAYVESLILSMGIHLPLALVTNPFAGGIINLPAVLIVLVLTVLLSIGVHESTKVNNIIVYIKFIAISVFVGIAMFHVKTANWHPFAPFGWLGAAKGAALIFFAYIGFDAVSTAADEAIEPQKTLPIGIMASLAVCTLIYVVCSGLLTGIVHYTSLNNAAPVAHALIQIGYNFGASVVSVGAIAGLSTVCLVMFYGLTRVMFAMSYDGLLPPVFSRVNVKTQTPIQVIIVCGFLIALVAGLTPIEQVAEIVNIGTLSAFVIVSAGVLVLRYTKPDLIRPFRVPFSPVVPLLGMGFCLYLMMNLPGVTWMRFLMWMFLGLIFYFAYGRTHSKLHAN